MLTIANLAKLLVGLSVRKIKPKFMTIAEIQSRMRDRKPMPTAIFSAKKTDYIVKPRTIFGVNKKSSKASIKW